MRTNRHLSLLLAGVLALGGSWIGTPSPLAAQSVESEDLAPPDGTIPSTDETSELLAEAERLFASPSQLDAVPLLGEAIEKLEQRLTDQDAVARLVRALSLRAQISFNFGDTNAATADIDRIVVLQPSFSFDATAVSPKLVQLASQVSKRRVGVVRVTLDPTDARLEIGGVVRDGSAPIPLLAGTIELTASRPGFETIRREIAVDAGATHEAAISLNRLTAVLWIRTRPAGATVAIDGIRIGATVPRDQGSPESEALAVEVQQGTRIIEAQLADHRPVRMTVTVPDLGDYRLEPLRLERAEAEVRLQGLPTGARVLVDGRVLEAGGGLLRLPPGPRRIAVDGGIRGQFEASLELADRQKVELAVVLRPALALTALLGGDRVAADRAAADLRTAFGTQATWTLLDRVADGTRVLGSLGVDASVLRGEITSKRLDWAAIQRGLDALSPASLHLLGALSDDLVASSAELVFLPAAPAAPVPERRHLVIGERGSRDAILAALEAPIRFLRPTLGAELGDGVDGVVVLEVRSGGPAERAGLTPGEVVAALDGRPVTSRAGLLAELHAASTSRVSLGLRQSSGQIRVAELDLAPGPAAARPDQPELLYSALLARIQAARAASAAPPWVLDLNEAVALLHSRALEEAIRRLRAIEAPSGPGLGREAADYWLGVALAAAGPSYHAAARDAFERAARRPDATFDDADGPLVAPAARARIAALGGS